MYHQPIKDWSISCLASQAKWASRNTTQQLPFTCEQYIKQQQSQPRLGFFSGKFSQPNCNFQFSWTRLIFREMQSSDDAMNLYNDMFAESREPSFLSAEPAFAMNYEAVCAPPLPEIRVIETPSNNSNVGGPFVFDFAYSSITTPIANGTNFIPQKRDNSHISMNSHFDVDNAFDLNVFDFTPQISTPELPFPQSDPCSQPMPKAFEIANESGVPFPLPVRQRQTTTIPISTQTIDSSAMLFPGQHSFLGVGNEYTSPATMSRRHSSPPRLSSSGLVASPSPISNTWIDEEINGDQCRPVDHLTPNGEKKKIRYIFSSQLTNGRKKGKHIWKCWHTKVLQLPTSQKRGPCCTYSMLI